MNTDPDRNHIELASAGAGKTYDLTSYIVKIIEHAVTNSDSARAVGAEEGRGSRPRDVVALTFSRAAAGEIFTRVVERIAKEALGKKSPEGKDGGNAAISALRRFLDEENRCQIGTIDSFLQTMARLVAERVDTPRDFRIVDEDEAASAREAAIGAMLKEAKAGDGPDSLSAAFLRANSGGRHWSFDSSLVRDAERLHADFLRAPDQDAWGNPDRIWKDNPGFRAKVGDIDDEARDRELRKEIADKANLLFDRLSEKCEDGVGEAVKDINRFCDYYSNDDLRPTSKGDRYTKPFFEAARSGDESVSCDSSERLRLSPASFAVLQEIVKAFDRFVQANEDIKNADKTLDRKRGVTPEQKADAAREKAKSEEIFKKSKEDLGEKVKAFRSLATRDCPVVPKETLDPYKKLRAFRDAAITNPVSLLSAYDAEKFLACANSDDEADAPVQFGRDPTKFTLLDKDTMLDADGTKAKEVLKRLFDAVRILAVRAACRRRRGQFELMKRFDEAYRREMSERGIATFDDIPRIIARAREKDPFFHLDMEFAVDGTFRHLALDEFQDTSPSQWTAVRNLADEARSAAGDGRSLFVVGDVKQAIYGWRGGDSRLLENLAENNKPFVERSRFSRRFGKEIACFVNAVFDAGNLRRSILGDASDDDAKSRAIDAWENVWADENGNPGHEVEMPADTEEKDPRPEPGVVEVVEVAAGKETDDWAAAFAAEIKKRIGAVNDRCKETPGCRRPEFAILVRKNEEGEALADALRDLSEPPVRWEGESSVSDSPVVAAVLDLLLLSEHPDSKSAAFGRVRCTPLPALFGFKRKEGKWAKHVSSANKEAYDADLSAEALGKDVAEGIARKGLQGLITEWADKIKAGMAVREGAAKSGDDDPNAFTASRLNSLVAAAGDWTRLPARDKSMTAFIRHVRSLTERVEAGASSVKIITIHRSKGLTFDQVFVPYFPGKSGFADTKRVKETQDDNPFSETYGSHVEWILDATNELCRLPGLKEAKEESEARDIESYCTNYVAMTRARRSLVVLMPKEREGKAKKDFARHVLDIFNGQREEFGWKKTRDASPDAGAVAWDDASATDWVDGLRRKEKKEEDEDEVAEAWAKAIEENEKAWSAAVADGSEVPLPDAVKRGEPSGTEAFRQDAGNLFASGELANEKGSGIHAFFETIEWLDGETVDERWVRAKAAEAGVALDDDTVARLVSALETPAFRDAFVKKTDKDDVWLEQSYEMFKPGENSWESGQFDRVVFRGEGPDRRADIYDFKTNKLRSGETPEKFAQRMTDTYSGQMAAYRAALARLCGLSPERISSTLLLASTMSAVKTR